MFKSYEYIKYLPETNEYFYEIEDDEFGIIEAATRTAATPAVVEAVVKAYQNKNLPIKDIGYNVALFCLFYKNEWNYTIEQIIKWQDQYCPTHINNWSEIAKERDEALKILELFK